ncbi:MAG: ankyrin repeat domain-containing protein [Pirellulales bacterium]
MTPSRLKYTRQQRGETGAISTLAKPLDNDDQRGRCPSLLFWAAVDGDCEIVDALLAAGADPNEAAYSLSALAAAARCGQLDVVRRLLEAGASITTSTNTVDALTCAVESQSEDVVETLIQAGADVNPKSMAGAPLLQAVKEGNIAIMKRLIAAGANIHFKWTIGNNLIGSAIGSFSDDDRPGDDALRDIIGTLVKHGVEIDAKNSFFRTPLMLATEANNEAAVETLLACGANPNIAAVAPDPSKDNSRFSRADHATALILAARAGHARIASRLIAAGADLDALDNSDLSALQWAKRNGHDEVIAVLVAAGAQADDSSPQALLAAARAGDLPAVQKALEAGLDVDVRDEVGALNEAIIGPTPLILAAAGGHGDIVAELLRSGADVDLQSSAFPTSISPLMAAAESGHIDVMEQLLAAGADVNLKNNGFEGARLQALHFAARGGQVEAAKLLLHHGARINAKTPTRRRHFTSL